MSGVSAADFDFVRRLLHERSAITLGDGKRYLVESRLAPVAEQQGLDSVGELVRMLRAGAGEGVRAAVVEALATNETSFFRDHHPWDALRDTIIPEALARNGGRQLSMWSAAASTGQEPYSMAMTVREHFPDVPNVRILASDLSQEVLDRARAGVFSQLEVNRGLPARLLVGYFERTGRDWRIADSVRRMVTFARVNIARPLWGIPQMDVVFLRNVLIYFDLPTKTAVLGEMSKVLRVGGYLFLGAAETTYGIDAAYERVQVGRTTCYRLTRRDRGSHGGA